MPLTLKNKASLEAITGKTWMHKGTTYAINDFTEIGDRIILSTDVKALTIQTDQVESFVKDLLPVEDAAPKNALAIPGVESNYFTEITGALMTSLREIQGSKDAKFLREATDRAKAKVLISKAVTDVAKTVIAAKKTLGH